MIRVYDGWFIDNDEISWTVCKATGKTDKKTGKEIYARVAHFSALSEALCEVARRNTLLRTQNGTMSLETAISIATEETERMKQYIRENIPEVFGNSMIRGLIKK